MDTDITEYEDRLYSVCEVPGTAPSSLEIKGIENGSEKTFRISEFKGRYLVIVFYHADYDCTNLVESFSAIKPLLSSNGTDLVFCSSDSTSAHKAWISAEKSRRGLGGSFTSPVWSDKCGTLATLFDLFDAEKNTCLDGVVIIDDNGEIRQVMTSSMDAKELSKNIVELIAVMKKHKLEPKPKGAMAGGRSARGSSPSFKVQLSVSDLEKDWDVSTDPELLKVLNVAKLLGRTAPPPIKNVKKVAMFNLLPTQIRKLANPRAPVKSVMASLQRNLAGFGQSGDLPANQRLQLENIMKKVMGVAYMPEDVTGKFTSLRGLNQREQTKLLGGDVFQLSYDDWMAAPGAKQWSEGQGVFVNNYNNFILWVNLEDQLRLVSVSKGQDLKYALLRLQKAVARIEEALKMIISVKSCNQRGFSTQDGGFAHTRREVYGTGFEVVITMDLLGLLKAGTDEVDKARRELGLRIEKCPRGAAAFTVVYNQSPEDSEEEIVTKTVAAVDSLARMDQELQSRLGVKLTL